VKAGVGVAVNGDGVGSLPIGRGVGARKQSSSVEARTGVVHGDVDRGSRGEHVGEVGCGKGRHGGVDGDGEDGGEACRRGEKVPSLRHIPPPEAVPRLAPPFNDCLNSSYKLGLIRCSTVTAQG
jgi:hypothetical protein